MKLELFKLGFIPVSLFDIIDILLVGWIFYALYRYFQNTRAGQMLVGIVIIMGISLIARLLNMSALSWLMRQLQTVMVIAFVILFQPELRRLLITIGQTPLIGGIFRVTGNRTIDATVGAAIELAHTKWGGLIVLQRDAGLRPYKERGAILRAEVSAELLISTLSMDGNPYGPDAPLRVSYRDLCERPPDLLISPIGG